MSDSILIDELFNNETVQTVSKYNIEYIKVNINNLTEDQKIEMCANIMIQYNIDIFHENAAGVIIKLPKVDNVDEINLQNKILMYLYNKINEYVSK